MRLVEGWLADTSEILRFLGGMLIDVRLYTLQVRPRKRRDMENC